MYTVLRHKKVWTKFDEGRSKPGEPKINRVPLLSRMNVWPEQRSSTSCYRYHKICSKICIFLFGIRKDWT